MQNLIPQLVLARGELRNQHQALLHGLLHCECCAAPMVYSYAAKGGRKYPYYVCRNAQRNGWDGCPSKSLPAQAIEDSVLGRVRQAQAAGADATVWGQMDRGQQQETINTLVEHVGYNGATRQVSIRFRAPKVHVEGRERRRYERPARGHLHAGF